MGAKEPVYVEILAMRGTVEEVMVTKTFESKEDSLPQAETSKEKEAIERKKRSFILNSLRMVRGIVENRKVLERFHHADMKTNTFQLRNLKKL